jgi:hypothetical protein
MSGILPSIWFPSDLRAVQQQLLADSAGVDQTVAGCPSLDAPTRASWASFYAGVKQFGSIDYGWTNTSGAAADQAQLLQRELFAWEQKLSTTCKLTVPTVDPTKTAGADAASGLNNALKFGAIAAGFIGSAYIVGKVLDWLPKPPARRLPAAR